VTDNIPFSYHHFWSFWNFFDLVGIDQIKLLDDDSLKFNENHDERGRFTSGDGASVSQSGVEVTPQMQFKPLYYLN
jgi:hypothetical protein